MTFEPGHDWDGFDPSAKRLLRRCVLIAKDRGTACVTDIHLMWTLLNTPHIGEALRQAAVDLSNLSLPFIDLKTPLRKANEAFAIHSSLYDVVAYGREIAQKRNIAVSDWVLALAALISSKNVRRLLELQSDHNKEALLVAQIEPHLRSKSGL